MTRRFALSSLDMLALLLLLPMAPPLDAQGTQFYYLPSSETEVEDDRFGQVLAVGDFDGDGRDDMAVGIPFKEVDGVPGAGMVVVSYGGNSLPDQILTAEDSGLPLEAFANYGAAVVAFDLSGGDNADKLAVGIPGATVQGEKTGAVGLWSGNPGGLMFPSIWVAEENPRQPGQRFGASLAAIKNALFIGAPVTEVDGSNSGAIYVATLDPQFGLCIKERIDQTSANVEGNSEDGDGWGTSLDVIPGADQFAWLLVGAPQEDIGSVVDAGAAWELLVDPQIGECSPGSDPSVLSGTLFRQGNGTIPGAPETGDLFGFSVAFGDFDRAGIIDIAVGVPREDRESDGLGDAGCVHIIDDSPGHACLFADQISDYPALPGQQTGFALAAADWDLDGYQDLLVGMPGHDDVFGRAGAAAVVNGSSTGLQPRLSLPFFPSSGGSFFGYGTSVAFIGAWRSGITQLNFLVGEPGYDNWIQDLDRVGRVRRSEQPTGMIFGDGFETGSTSEWDATIP
ncbi:MAG: integrin alpha [Acidobacteriota bacterium]